MLDWHSVQGIEIFSVDISDVKFVSGIKNIKINILYPRCKFNISYIVVVPAA